METTVVHCKTRDEANELLKFLHKKGFKWNCGNIPIKNNNWDEYKEKTCYYIYNTNIIEYGSIDVARKYQYEIITFKQFMEMKETKELKIEIPEGFEIDIENSDLASRIVRFKPKTLTYDNIAEKLFSNKKVYFTNDTGDISATIIEDDYIDIMIDANNCTSEKQAQKLLAINKLMNVAKYLNDGWKPDWKDSTKRKYYIRIYEECIEINSVSVCHSGIVFFKTEELAKQAIEILGEGIIKLALSTDW